MGGYRACRNCGAPANKLEWSMSYQGLEWRGVNGEGEIMLDADGDTIVNVYNVEVECLQCGTVYEEREPRDGEKAITLYDTGSERSVKYTMKVEG